jgi:hypothetical protein
MTDVYAGVTGEFPYRCRQVNTGFGAVDDGTMAWLRKVGGGGVCIAAVLRGLQPIAAMYQCPGVGPRIASGHRPQAAPYVS